MSTPSHELERDLPASQEPHLRGDPPDFDPPDFDLKDVSALLARLVQNRVPLTLIADLASPDGPRSDQIMASEAQDVG